MAQEAVQSHWQDLRKFKFYLCPKTEGRSQAHLPRSNRRSLRSDASLATGLQSFAFVN